MENDSSNNLTLRIFISSTDKYKDKLLYEHIVFRAKECGLAGATVIRGVLGFGASSVIHSLKFWEVSEKVPTVVEIIDREDKIHGFYTILQPELEAMRYGCLVTIEPVRIVLYKNGKKRV